MKKSICIFFVIIYLCQLSGNSHAKVEIYHDTAQNVIINKSNYNIYLAYDPTDESEPFENSDNNVTDFNTSGCWSGLSYGGIFAGTLGFIIGSIYGNSTVNWGDSGDDLLVTFLIGFYGFAIGAAAGMIAGGLIGGFLKFENNGLSKNQKSFIAIKPWMNVRNVNTSFSESSHDKSEFNYGIAVEMIY
ncbi:hypothetical protein ACFL20_06755 [Spirochaetota bacterium]